MSAAPYTLLADRFNCPKAGTNLGRFAFTNTPEGWPVYRFAGTQRLSFCFWAARPTGTADIGSDLAGPRRPKTKRESVRVRRSTQATPLGFRPPSPRQPRKELGSPSVLLMPY
jgi:hypothetical protein